jgi:transposase InsO family protein
METLLTKYYWFGKSEDIKKWVKMCSYCDSRKPCVNDPPLQPIVATKLRERIMLDFFDLTDNKRDKKTNARYVLTMIDCFSKRCWLKAFPTKEAKPVANFVKETFKDSAPDYIQFDNGKEFCNNAMESILEELNSEQKKSITILSMG